MNFVSKSLEAMGIGHICLRSGCRFERLIDELYSGTVRIIIATDVASRYFKLLIHYNESRIILIGRFDIGLEVSYAVFVSRRINL